jgi:Family of unknown function (DUF6502)
MSVEENTEAITSFNRAEKVVTAWLHEYPKASSPSLAARLPLEGKRSFAALVKEYSGDMPVRAVLDELLRVGVVGRVGDDEVELLSRGTVLPDAENREAMLGVFGTDVADFVGTTAGNVMAPPDQRLFQRKAWFDNVPVEPLGVSRKFASQHGQSALESFADFVSRFDRDVTPNTEGTGRARVVFGVYYHEEVIEPAKEEISTPAKRDPARKPAPPRK